ncbi:hypothetical protein [Jiella sonneratiae]|uniref:Uncharacterized protein n=1 Tax=Jiella sonneratiae TaxID=2816856 RepID=A0ABS3J283_9HYPH|nr:hypothetical protein [Jiella sonneratiae]MBO0903778.1 hypothetical protein [Jiella sonneratiae]
MSVVPYWLLVAAAVTLLSWILVLGFVASAERLTVFALLAAIALVASTAGFIGGLSRVGVAGQVIAAALSLIGGLVTYLFGIDRSKGAVIPICAMVFSAALFLAYFKAADMRAEPERYALWRAQCLSMFSSKDLLNDPIASLVVDNSFGEICRRIFLNEKTRLLTP